MAGILVGVDGTARGRTALEWAVRRAERSGAPVTMLTVIDPRQVREAGADAQAVCAEVGRMLEALRAEVAAAHPAVSLEARVVEGGIVDTLVDAADEHDIVVLGSHHGASIGETIGGAKGLRVSVSTQVPTAVVPADWDPEGGRTGIMVGVGPDEASDAAVEFGVREALGSGEPLVLVSGWGLPEFLSKPARAMGGGLDPVGDQFQRRLDERVAQIRAAHPELQVEGRAVEGSSPTRVLIDCAKDYHMLVLGTHSRTALGRALFGSVSHGVLLELPAPCVVVPQPEGE